MPESWAFLFSLTPMSIWYNAHEKPGIKETSLISQANSPAFILVTNARR